ncbi:MAG: aminopeptidase P N-terminal domain-containing protein, partial [Rugosibacter sp.]
MDNSSPSPKDTCFAACRQRRLSLIARMQQAGGGVAVIPTAPEQTRNRDAQFPYRPDSYFQYLTGFNEPEAALVIVAAPDAAQSTAQSILFCREKNAERETWDGFRYGPDAAKEAFAFDAAHSIDAFDAQLAELLADQPALWFSLGHDAAWDARIIQALNA